MIKAIVSAADMNEKITNCKVLANALYVSVMECNESTDEMLSFTLLLQQELELLEKLLDSLEPGGVA